MKSEQLKINVSKRNNKAITMTSCGDESEVWGCGVCTFLNKPLFLSCEMCGQARPSQRPNPPRRRPSLVHEVEIAVPEAYRDDCPINIGASSTLTLTNNTGIDRAPRSVQRHRSTINITGTLIMTDDPNDYESQDGKKKPTNDYERQDGKKPATVAEEEEQEESHARRTGVEDPTMDESLDPMFLEDPAHGRFSERSSSRRGRSRVSELAGANSKTNGPPRRRASRESAASIPVSSNHEYQQKGPPTLRKVYPAVASYNTSHNTDSTQFMGSSSSRMGLDDAAMDDVSEISNLSSSLRRPVVAASAGGGSSRRIMMVNDRSEHSLRSLAYLQPVSQPHNHIHAQRSTHDIHWHQRNGLPVIDGPPRATQLMGDRSYSSLYSTYGNEGSMRSPLSTPRGARCSPALPPQHLHDARRSSNQAMSSSMSSLTLGPPAHYQQKQQEQQHYQRKATSAAASTSNLDTSSSDFLPPIAPPPVPIMDMPTDVNVMEVFVKDHRAAERRASSSIDHGRRLSATESVRKGRASMLDNLARNNFTSNRSVGGANLPTLASMRSMPQGSSRVLGSTRTISAAAIPVVATAVVPPAETFMLQDDEALDSPRTRKERLKERRKMKGAVRSFLATMRISSR
jgi:hypothetical protein